MKYKIIKMRLADSKYIMESVKVYPTIDKLIKMKKSTYVIDVEHPTYYELSDPFSLKFSSYLVFVIADGKQLSYHELVTLNKEALDLFITQHVFTHMATNMNKQKTNLKEQILYMILGAVAGLCAGMFIGQQIEFKNIFGVQQ